MRNVVYSTCKTHPNLGLQWWFPFTQNKFFFNAYCKTRARKILKGCCFCPTELLSTGCGSSSHSYHAQQLYVLAGVWWCLCLWVPGWKRLPEFLLLLRRVQRWSVAKGPCAYRHFGTRCILSCLLSHLFPFIQCCLLGRLLVSLAVPHTSQCKELDFWFCQNRHEKQTFQGRVKIKVDTSYQSWAVVIQGLLQ